MPLKTKTMIENNEILCFHKAKIWEKLIEKVEKILNLHLYRMGQKNWNTLYLFLSSTVFGLC